MAQSIIVRRKGLAALFPANYQITQTTGEKKTGKLKKAKERIDNEKSKSKAEA